MRAKWLWGAVITVSVAANLILGGTLIGLHAQRHFHPFSVAMKKVKTLPPEERQIIRATVRTEAPQLRQSLKAVREARADLGAYISSPGYNRAEAQRRFDDLRAKTAQSQVIAETMFLDVADKLPPADRAKLLDAGK